MPAVSTIIWVAFGVFFGYVLWKSGIAMLRSMTTVPPEPATHRRTPQDQSEISLRRVRRRAENDDGA